MKKNGFTLVEVLMVLTIIGIIMMAAVATIRPFDKGIRYLYTNAAVSLDRAFYNAMNVSGCPNPFDDVSNENENEDENEEQEQEKDTGAKKLCEALTQYINPIDKADSCKEDRIVSPMANSFPDDKIQFVAVNGMRFYTSPRISGKVNENGPTYNFYIVFVDVNGEKGVNSAEYIPEDATDNQGKKIRPKTPDIFAFAALPLGRIIPIGAPEIDTKFMTTRIMYLNENMNTRRFTATPKAYFQTKADAWGYYTGAGSMQMTISTYDPYTYNDVVRTVINNNYENNFIYKNAPIPEPSKVVRDPDYLALEDGVEDPTGETTRPTKPENMPSCHRNIDQNNYEDALNTCKVHIDNYAF